MSKYRIVEVNNSLGNVYYEIQERILFIWTCFDIARDLDTAKEIIYARKLTKHVVFESN